jgi:protein phosphatase
MPLEFADATDVGRCREENEDAILVMPEQQLAVVCDGVGGASAILCDWIGLRNTGEIASTMAVETVKMFFALSINPVSCWPFRYDHAMDESSNKITTAARWANQRIRDAGRAKDGRNQNLATTFVAVLVSGARATFGWVGDSRGYLYRRGELRSTTSDHSLINDYLRAVPDLTPEQRDELPRHVVTRALGMAENVKVDVNAFDMEAGDICLVCSDGLTDVLSDERIADVLAQEQCLQFAAQRLVDEANTSGGVDNITLALVRYTE